jgi:hypothetical protein
MHLRVKMSLLYLVLGSLLTPPVTIIAQNPAVPSTRSPLVETKIITSSGRDSAGVPFLLSANGEKGRFVSVTSKRIEVELTRQAGSQEQPVGRVQLDRHSASEVEVAFTSWTGNTLAFKTRNSEPGAVTTNLRFNQMVVSLDRLSDFNGGGLKSAKSLEIEGLFTRANADPTIRDLTSVAIPFLSASSLRMILPFAIEWHGHVTDCAVEAADCLVALVTYGTSMSILYSACGFTFGASCVGALIAHPIIGGAVAVYCGRALSTCGITR